ncbi:lipid A deacylase LpxR family protein [Derxia lacustris]|uniref:lipid A deacylase LpxR family protein n=1 Tax=Derxia lacustris TaxID=764842 RepID=UPI000A170A56|nr:lipid A deacylase LpxR family protein [Derxia lacustris]
MPVPVPRPTRDSELHGTPAPAAALLAGWLALTLPGGALAQTPADFDGATPAARTAAAPSAAAGSADRASAISGWRFLLDNDRFVLPARSDGGYTGGWRFDYGFAPAATPGWLEPARQLGGALLGGPATLDFSLGQLAYTPRDARIATPQPDERPWAGLLYAALSAHRLDAGFYRSLELKLGVVGPASLARQAQKEVHRIVGSDDPAGWDNQLRAHPAAQVEAIGVLRAAEWGPLGVDVNAGAVAGTLRNYGEVGLGLVLGARPPRLPALTPNVHERVVFDAAAMRELGADGWHGLSAFAHAGAQFYASNRFITGGTYGPRPEVDVRHSVGTISAGLHWAFARDWTLSYVQIRRGADYVSRNPAVGETPERWGGVQLTHTCGC